MIQSFRIQTLIKSRIFSILKFSFITAIVASLAVYCSVRLLFFEIRNPLKEEFLLLLKVVTVAFQIGAGISIFLITISSIEEFIKRPRFPQRIALARVLGIVVLLCTLFSFDSVAQTKTGIKKDINSGLVTTYQQLEPAEIEMVMNDEVIHHHDIPLGEKFIIRNKNVKGFVIKNGKVSVGCALTISDTKGKKVLDIVDLFKGKDVFKPEDMNNLKCTISTGNPMDWEKMYTVQVTYWDKYGKGKLVNKIKIRTIDIP